MVLVDEPRFGRVRNSVFPVLGLVFRKFVPSLYMGSEFGIFGGFEVWFWQMNLGLSEFEVLPVMFEAV